MRWLQNIAFSYFPSSSSTTNQTSTALIDDRSSAYSSRSTRNNNKNNNSNNNNNNNNNNNSIHNRVNRSKDRNNINKDLPGPRLTRQKKLRHLSDQEVIGAAKFSPPLFSDSVGLSRSQSSYDNFSSPSSSSAFKSSPSTATAHPMPLPLPLPLPLPEENGELRLRSPKETAGLGRVVEEREKEKERDGFRDRDRVDGAAEEVPSSSSPIASVFPNRVSMNNKPEYLEKNSSRNVYQSDRNSLESSREKFKMDIPFQSAPSSPFGSPVVSPQGMNVSEMFQYNCSVSKGHKVWSAPEMPILDAPGLPPPAFFDYTAISADNSPFHSPRSRSPCRTPISPNGSSSPINSKLSRQNTGHIEVHPLPLPPGAAIPSPSSPISQVPAKPESLRMKSQWQKGKLIGRGTFGSVYVASNRETGALCAMKEVDMFPDDPKSAESIKQLEQEIKVLSNLKHPNIVQYYGSEIVEDKFYIYLEYVHPGSINKYVREHCGTMTESIVRNFTRHILSGLTYLHSKKTIHRDIKGANLLVDASGVVKLADFGMAKHLNGQVADLSLKGSPYWMAPELMISVMQRDNTSDLALAVDIWSLGCTIIEMYTGKPPWSEFEGAAAMFKVMKDTPSIPECLSAEGKDFLRCCFQRNPAERPSASKLLEHRFLKNSQQPDVPSWTMAFSGMNLTDRPHSPRQQSESKVDQLPVSPSPSTRKEFESERQQSLREASHITFVSHFSPRSTLEALPSASPPRSAHHAHHPSPYALTLGLTSIGAKNGTPR